MYAIINVERWILEGSVHMNEDVEFGFGAVFFVFTLVMIGAIMIFVRIYGGFTITESNLDPVARYDIMVDCKNIILDTAEKYDYDVSFRQVNIHGNEGAFFKYHLKKDSSIFYIHVSNYNEVNGELYVTYNHYTDKNDESFDVDFFCELIQKTCQSDFKKETCKNFIEADEETYPDLERGFDVLKDDNVYKMMYINEDQYNILYHLVDYETEPNEYYLMFEGWSDEIVKNISIQP
jgi:hypothetical protein